MTFELFETSRDDAVPVDLYLFQYGTGAGSYSAYTDHEYPVTHSGIVYAPIPISRGSITSAGTLDKAALEVRMPHTVDLAERYRIYPPSSVISMIIRQGHLEDLAGEFLVVWTGRIINVTREASEVKFVAEPVSTSLKRPGLRRHYQYTCPHPLYGEKCRALKARVLHNAPVQSLSGTVVTLFDGWNGVLDPSKFIGGLAEWEGTDGHEMRTILQIADGKRLTLSGLLRDVTVGSNLQLYPGCNHQMDDCLTLHDNIHNFGGQPWIPTKNPIGFRNQFY